MKGVKILVLTMFAMLMASAAWSAELAGYWSFDENQGTVAKTSAVSGYDGEIHGAKWVPGKVGSALKFNGEGDYVEIKDTAADSPFALTSMSISAWIKPEAYPQPSPVRVAGIAGKRLATESTYGLRLSHNGRAYFTVYGPFGEGGKIADFHYTGGKDQQISLNEWHYVVVTYDNTSIKFYINGKLIQTYKETRLPGINKQSIFIGSTNGKMRYFKGIIDEVKIYKGALTDAEVAAEYRSEGKPVRTTGNLPKISEVPSLDGTLSDPCWQKALKVEFVNNSTVKTPKAATTGYVCYDDKNLYIAFLCKEPLMDRIKANVAKRSVDIWQDDCVEVFIDPGASRKSYYHFIMNSKNVQFEEKFTTIGIENGWVGAWQSATSKQADGWTAEMKIPLSNFALASNIGTTWGLNLCRERKTEPENTAWSPTFLGFHAPEMFGTVREFNTDFAPYQIEVSAPALSYIFKNEKPSLQYTQSFTNSSQKARQVRIRIWDSSDKEILSKEISMLPGKKQDIILPISVRKDGNTYRFNTEIADSADGRVTYKAVRVAKSPVLIQSYFDRSYYTDENTASLCGKVNIDGKLPSNVQMRVILQSHGKTVRESSAPVSGARFSVPVPLKSLPAGEYTATVSIMVKNDTIYAETLSLSKYPPADYTVKMDAKNLCVLVDGKPFFPMGMLSIPDILIPEYAEAGFNIGQYNSPDIAYYNGFKTVAATYYAASRENYKTMEPDALAKKVRRYLLDSCPRYFGGTVDRIKTEVSPRAKQYWNHPAFTGYFWDEPQVDEAKGAEVLCNVTRDLDPYHPIMPVFYRDTDPTIPSSIYDIYGADIYWFDVPSSKKYKSCGRLILHAATAEKLHKPFWLMPSAAGYVASTALTPAEQRIQTYLGLIYGARGIFYWSYLQMYPAMAVELKKLGREVRELSPALLTQSPDQTVTGVEETDVHALAKIHGGDCYLLTANNSADEEKTMRIKTSAPAGVKSAKVLFENRTVPVKDGAIDDKFAPYATHVYVLPKADARKPIQIAIKKLASVNVPMPNIRRWPDFKDTLDEEIGNPGFEDAEEGQPRIWISSCGWETPEYCALDTKEFHQGARSLRLSIPQTTRYMQETGFGWSAESKVTAFYLGKLRRTCRYGHRVSNGLFKVDLPNGKYSVKVTANTSELFEMKNNTRQSVTAKTVEIPVPKGIENIIKESAFDVTVEGGQFNLFIPSGSIYSLTITPKSVGSVQAFDFGPGDAPVSAGHKLVSASKIASMYVTTQNNDSKPRIKLSPNNKNKISVYMKSDTPNMPVSIVLRIGERVIGSARETKTMNIGTEWQKYEIPVPKKGPYAWVHVELKTPGTVWVDDFKLEKN
jgi:hypothetical protein